MADIRLSETSSGRSQKINTGLGSSVITREQGCTITVAKATIYMGDDNFIITFTEEDRMEMESLEGAFLAFAQKAQVMDGASGTDLSKILLPKKSIPKKAVEVPKKAAKKVKSMMSRTPVEEESTEETSDESTE